MAPMAEDCSPQRGPSGQPERSESSLTEPEVTDEETTEDQDAVEQQECGHRHGCDLSKDSAALTPRTDATLPSEKASATPRASVAQGWWSKGQSICNVSIGVLVACARRTAQEVSVLALSLGAHWWCRANHASLFTLVENDASDCTDSRRHA